LTRDHHNRDDGLVLEGSNVTLICRAYLFALPPKWAYYLKDSDTHPIYIDETMSPPQLGKSRDKRRTNRISVMLKHFLDPLLADGMKIVTKNDTDKGEIVNLKIYDSFLELKNVSKNSPTTFQCMDGNINATRISVERAPIFSFNVSGND
jgi:hypothetical protein